MSSNELRCLRQGSLLTIICITPTYVGINHLSYAFWIHVLILLGFALLLEARLLTLIPSFIDSSELRFFGARPPFLYPHLIVTVTLKRASSRSHLEVDD